VIVTPEYERAPLEYYRPEIRPAEGRLVAVDQVVLLGYPLEDDTFPPGWFRLPPAFRRVEFRLYDRIRLVRFRAPRVQFDAAPAERDPSAAVFVDPGGP